jgi:glycerol-3-phosphate dehydrogenase (NAD(P)+)
MSNVGVIGGGSWATALVKILSNNVSNINWWMRSQETVDYINKYQHNPNYLSSVELLPEKVLVSTQIKEVISKSDILVLAVPAAFIEEALASINPTDLKDKILISAISGPCHAEEVALEKLSYLTISCQNEGNARHFASLMNCRYIKTSTSDDIYGTEYAAVLKNVFAIASGIAHGIGYGDNFLAVLISNAIQEIKRFVDTVHPVDRDIKSSAYLGDLLVTAYSQFSRNRSFGSMVGKGYSVKSAQLEMNMIAEGYYAVKCIYEINKKYQVNMPITDAVYRILYERISPRVEMKLLSDKLS